MSEHWTRTDPALSDGSAGGEIGRGPHGPLVVVAGPDGVHAVAEVAPADAASALDARLARVGSLRHPFLMRVDERVVLDGAPALLLEDFRGVGLDELFALGRPVPTGAAVDLFRKAARALHAAYDRVPGGADHPHGLVHGQLAATSLRLDEDGNLRLHGLGMLPPLDPGGASLDDPADAGAVLPLRAADAWMAPELLGAGAEPADADHATDIYALGAMLAQTLTGEPAPWASASQEWHDAAVSGAVVQVLEATDEQELAELVGAMLAFAPGERPAGAQVEKVLGRLRRRLGRTALEEWAEGAVPAARAARAERLALEADLAGHSAVPAVDDEVDTAEIEAVADLSAAAGAARGSDLEDDTAENDALPPPSVPAPLAGDDDPTAERDRAAAAEDAAAADVAEAGTQPDAGAEDAASEDAASEDAASEEAGAQEPEAASEDGPEERRARRQLWEIPAPAEDEQTAAYRRAARSLAAEARGDLAAEDHTDRLDAAFAREQIPDPMTEDDSDVIQAETAGFRRDALTGHMIPATAADLAGTSRSGPAAGEGRIDAPGSQVAVPDDGGDLTERPVPPVVPTPGTAGAPAASTPTRPAAPPSFASARRDDADLDFPPAAGGADRFRAAGWWVAAALAVVVVILLWRQAGTPDAPPPPAGDAVADAVGSQEAAPAREPGAGVAEEPAAEKPAAEEPAAEEPAAEEPAAEEPAAEEPAAEEPAAEAPPAPPKAAPDSTSARARTEAPPPRVDPETNTPRPIPVREKPADLRPPPPAPAPEPAPEPEPEPEPAAAAETGTLKVEGDADTVILLGADGTPVQPGTVPAGTYQVRAVFSGIPVDGGTVTVAPGGTRTVRCLSTFMRCTPG